MSLDIKQLDFGEIKLLPPIDLFIIGLGYEHRASFLATQLKNVNERYCIELVEDVNQEERLKIANLGFQFIQRDDLKRIFQNEFKIALIDFSVMMKSLYAEILTLYNNSESRQLKLYFSYTHAMFENATDKSYYVESIKPILLTDEKLMIDIPRTKLIISLGYEKLSAIGVIENLEIDYHDVIILINKTDTNSEHYQECIKVNQEFLEQLDPSQIIEFNFYNFNQLSSILDSILFRLQKQNYRVIISPLSVKTFSLYAMVQSTKYDNVIFYNVTSINSEPNYKKDYNEDQDPLVYTISKDESPIHKII